MKELLTKRLDEIGPDDIKRLIDTEAEESASLELKGPLPVQKNQTEPWRDGKDKILPQTRDKILAEVVGMANAAGGIVLLGIDESEDEPPRASKVLPLPNCVGLASRLEDMAWSCIEPRLPNLEVVGIPLEKDGSGVVLFRVQPSGDSPHGLSTTRQAYIRRGTNTETLFMREIRDLALRRASVVQALEDRLESRRTGLQDLVGLRVGGAGLRITVVPTVAAPAIAQIYDRADVFVDVREFVGQVGQTKIRLTPPHRVLSINSFGVKPTLRGGVHTSGADDQFSLSKTILDDGLVEFLFYFLVEEGKEPYFYLGWVLALVCNTLAIADLARRAAGAPGAELLADIEILGVSDQLLISGFEETRFLGVADREIGQLEVNPLRLPSYLVGDSAEFSGVVKRVMNDIREAAGLRGIDDFEVNFE